MDYNEYFFKYEYEERKKQLDALIFRRNGAMTPIKKPVRNWSRFNPFSRKKQD